MQHGRREQGRGHADDDADGKQDSGIAQHQLQHRAALRSQRHADTDLAGAPADRISHHAIESHDGEHDRQPGESPQQNHGEALLRKLAEHQLAHGMDLSDRHVFVERGDELPQGGLQAAGLDRGAHHGVQTAPGVHLRRRQKHGRSHLALRRGQPAVSHHAYDLPPGRTFGDLRYRRRA